jgi:hypothetical protein
MALLVAAGWAVLFAVLARGVFGRRRDAIIPLAAAATATLSLLHSCLDFTLQVPGYSIPFFALFGAGLAQSFRTETAVAQGHAPSRHVHKTVHF